MELSTTLETLAETLSGDRWFGIGRSTHTDTTRAARFALDQALAAVVDPATAKLAIVFAAETHCSRQLLDSIAMRLPGVAVVGCSTAGEIAVVDNHATAEDGTVVVAVLGGDISVATSEGSMISGELLRAAASDAAGIVDQISERTHRALLVLTDGISESDQCEIVRGVYESAGATVPLIGGCAGDDLRFKNTVQLHGRKVLTHSFVMAAMGSDSPIGVGVAHGWCGVGEPMLVTEVEGTRIIELDNRPAVDVYLERLGADPIIGAHADSFSAFSLTHPLALIRRRGDEIRWVNGCDVERRSIHCNVEIQRNAQVWLTKGDVQSTIDAVAVACEQALSQLKGAKPIGAIAFNCAARRAVLGPEGLDAEVEQIANHLGGIPVAGFYTYGEFSRVRGPNGFHNQTLVMLVFS
jgi:hypothetical protein